MSREERRSFSREFKLAALVFLLTASPVWAQSGSEAFDLVCQGSQVMPAHPEAPRIVWNERYHIDIAHRMFCRADCKVPGEIARVEKARIWLVKEPGYETYVDRYSGYFYQNGAGFLVEATCKLRTGTRFPRRKF
jgi:hypothetical protein